MKLKTYLIFLSLSLSSFGETFNLIKNKEKLVIQNPKNWKGLYNFLGFPLIFNGPYDKINGRPNLSITMTGVEEPGFKPEELSQTQERYFVGRKKWVEDRNGIWIKEVPFEVLSGKNKNKIYSIGFEYKLNDREFFEQTFFYFCPQSMVHMKLLMGKIHKAYYPNVIQVIKNATCINLPK